MRRGLRAAALLGAAAVLGAACTRVGSPVVGGSPVPPPVPSPSPSPAAAVPGWQRLPSAPTERLEAVAAAVGGRLYLAGGLRGGATDVVESYDPGSRRWRSEPPLPEPLHHASAVEYGGKLVVLGGFHPAGGQTFGGASDAVYALGCPEGVECRGSGEWVRLPDLPRRRGAGAAGVVRDRIVFAGGQAGGRLVGPTDVFDGRRWSARAPIPTERDHLSGASDGDFLYAIGGRTLSISSVLDAVERYDPSRDRWERLPDLPTARGGFGAAFVAHPPALFGLIVTVGGEGSDTANGTFDDVEAFDIEGDRWDRLEPLPVALHASGVAAIGGTVYSATGGPRAGGSTSDHLFSLQLS